MGRLLNAILDQKAWFWMQTGLVLLLAYYIGSSINSYRRLRHFKGPPLAAWSFLWNLRAVTSGEGHLRLSEVCEKYGPIARIGPNILMTSDEELYRRINSRAAGYSRAYWYKSFRFGADKENLISELDNQKHHDLRKRLAPGYSGKDNLHLENDMDKVIWSLIDSWKERYLSNGSDGKPVDLSLQVQYLTLDIITALSCGQSMGFIKTDSDLYDYIATTNKTIPAMNFCSSVPAINWLLGVQWIQRLIAPSTNDRMGLGKIKAVSKDILTRRFAEAQLNKQSRSKSDMTGSFIAHELTLDEITDNSLLNILAGSDTTAVALRSAFITIITQPRVHRRLLAEIDGAGVPLDQIIPYSRSLELPYLQACIKEALRFHPVSTGLLPRVVPPKGDYYKGQFIPGGTLIGQCGWGLQRLNFDLYGSDANHFRPERWTEAAELALAGKPELLERMERNSDSQFSSGEFKCLGFQISLMELSKILFEVFRRFEMGFMDGFCTLKHDGNHGLFVQEGMWMRIEAREEIS